MTSVRSAKDISCPQMTQAQSAKDYVTQLLNFVKYNTKAYTPRMLSKATNVPLDIVTLWLQAIDSFTFVKVRKSPSGRFINFRFNKYAKTICYSDSEVIYYKGVETNYCTRPRNGGKDIYFEDALSKLPDMTKKDGILYVRSRVTQDQWVELFLKAMGLYVEAPPAVLEDPVAEYPLVKERRDFYVTSIAKLEQEIQKEKDDNASKKTWFEQESRKARRGERTRSVMRQNRNNIVGYMPGARHVYKDSEWNGGNTIVEYDDPVPEYETYYEQMPDYPAEPVYYDDKQRANPSKIKDLQFQLSTLLQFPMKYEKQFKEQQERVAEVQALEAQRRELDRKIQRLRC